MALTTFKINILSISHIRDHVHCLKLFVFEMKKLGIRIFEVFLYLFPLFNDHSDLVDLLKPMVSMAVSSKVWWNWSLLIAVSSRSAL